MWVNIEARIRNWPPRQNFGLDLHLGLVTLDSALSLDVMASTFRPRSWPRGQAFGFIIVTKAELLASAMV